MRNYHVDLNNTTDRTWTMAIYRGTPNATGQDNIAWKRTEVPPLSTGGIDWEHGVGAPRPKSPSAGIAEVGQALLDELAHEWDIVYTDGVQRLRGAPTYWVGLFRDVRAGEALGGNFDIGPIELQFPEGTNTAVIDIVGQGNSTTHRTTYASR
ncbi:hypothetical protein [Desulfovibrio sp. Huiquan2017]|uniref:hypothetical protein n=1 Tax=Desulfovibrio sp. Huiquan2017 TaxID=2816861 RepID=UPI001A938D64|nr:hypothetical protein [Desulfovibrio sp. Huiquan2017]